MAAICSLALLWFIRVYVMKEEADKKVTVKSQFRSSEDNGGLQLVVLVSKL